MNLLKFSENLRQALSASGMTQQNLADLLSTTQATVSRWLYGINEPEYETLLKICLYLNETPNSLLGFDDIPNDVVNSYYDKAKNK